MPRRKADPHQWTKEEQETLKYLLHEGYSMRRCAIIMELPETAVRTEIKKSISDEHFENCQYIKYDPEKAIDIQVERYRRKLEQKYEQ